LRRVSYVEYADSSHFSPPFFRPTMRILTSRPMLIMTVAEEVVLLLLSWQYIHPALRRYGDHDVGRVWWWWFRLLRRLFINNASQWETTDDDNINNMTERDKANNFMMPPKRIILSWYGLDATFMTLSRNWKRRSIPVSSRSRP